jgi:membrane dipeptidase
MKKTVRNFGSYSRRDFLKAAALSALAPVFVKGQTVSQKADFPFVDGLTLDVLKKPEDIRASGLTALVYDVSDGETLPDCDGAPKWRRTFEATARSLATAREKIPQIPNVFLATAGKQIKEAFKNGKTAVFFQVQGGGEIVGEDLSRLERLRDLGVRVFQVTHHHNNPLGGGGVVKTPSGLTKLGFEAVERMNRLGIVPDLSHSSDQTGLDTLKASKKPVVVSHGAARALVNNARCTPDSVIRGIADSGGVMGIFMMSFWLTTDEVPTVESYLRQIRHVIKVGGIDAVGISNDFPLAGGEGGEIIKTKEDNAKAVRNYLGWWYGMTEMGVLGFDKIPTHVVIPALNNIRRMQIIYEALEKDNFKPAEIEKIMGANWIRVLSE